MDKRSRRPNDLQ